MSEIDLIRAALRANGFSGSGEAVVHDHARGLYPLYRVSLPDGVQLAAKVEPSTVAQAEQQGLAALADAGVPVPQSYPPHCQGAEGVLLMEFLDGRFNSDVGKALAETLAVLYQHRGEHWGWHSHNFIGTLPQKNSQCATFDDSWWYDRIEPQMRRAVQSGRVDKHLARDIESVTRKRAEDWGLNEVGPRLLHGDLWSGNLLPAEGGVYLIDPAVAYGHPEQDLAMLHLFGHPMSPADEERVAAAAGLAPGVGERCPYFQMYPLLVHVNIFGTGYVSQLASAVRKVR